jgi:non-ribosomal peptide synthetase component F
MPDSAGTTDQCDDTGPLSYQQRQIWLADQNAPEIGLYNEACALHLRGPLRLDRLRLALARLVEDNDALRTTFPVRGGELVQAVGSVAVVPLAPVIDITGAPSDSAALDAALSLARARVESPFDTGQGPLMRCFLFRLAEEEHLLVLNVHHLVCDGSSLRLLLRQLAARYVGQARPERRELACYLDFARGQGTVAGEQAADLAYVRDRLADAPSVVELPPDRYRRPVKRYRGRRDAFPVGPATVTSLAALARAADGSRLAVLAATFAGLVYRYTGRTDLVVGTSADPRPERFAETVGIFANLVPMRLRPTGDSTVRQLLDGGCDAAFDAIDFAAVPLEKLVEALRPVRDPSHPQLVQLVCAIWDRDYSRITFGDVDGALVEIPRGRSRFDLMVEHVFDADAWTMFVEYDTDLYEPATVADLVRHYTRVIDAAAADLDASLASLSMLSSAECGAARAGAMQVRDCDGNVLPAGAVGELFRVEPAGGAAEPTPTGQVARRQRDGSVEPLGLASRRVCLGGLGVQLERLEAVILASPGVRRTAVLPPAGPADAPAAFVVLDGSASPAALRARLADRLPGSSLPTITPVPEIPLAPDSTPDAAALRSIGAAGTGACADDGLEQTVLDAWSQLLPTAPVAVDDDFFELGGYSMLAAQLAQDLGDRLGVDVSVRDVFLNPTVRELAAALAEDHPGLLAWRPGTGRAPAGPGEPLTRSPVSVAQLQIYLNERLTLGAADDFNSAFAHRVTGPLDASALRLAFDQAVGQHPCLRACFTITDDMPELHFTATASVQLPIVEVEQLPADERLAEALRLARTGIRERFDIDRPPLLRAMLIRLSPEDHILAYALHHLVTDGVSMAVIHRDLAEAYAAAVEGRPPEFPAAGAHYADYVSWERTWLEGGRAARARAYWRDTLAGASPLDLPTRADGPRADLAVGTCRQVMSADTTRRLAEFSRGRHATPFMAATAALAVVLRRWSGQDDLVVGTLVDNRPPGGWHGTVGCFANLVPLRISCRPDQSFGDLVERVRDVLLGAYEHQYLPFSEIVRATGAARSFARMPIFQTTVQQVRPEVLTLRLAGCSSRPMPANAEVSRFELTLFVTDDPEGLVLDLEYALDLWDAAAVERRAAQLAAVLAAGAGAPSSHIGELPC